MGDWVVVLSALDKLHRVGKETRVLSSGRPLPESRIKRARRYRSGKTDSQPQGNLISVSAPNTRHHRN